MISRLCFTISALAAMSLTAEARDFSMVGTQGSKLFAKEVARFDRPWAMTFLPDKSLLVTTKPGNIFHVTQDGQKAAVRGVPKASVGGQGGLGDVVLHPNYAQNGIVYISYVEQKGRGLGAVVMRAELRLNDAGGGRLSGKKVIWRQAPKVSGRGHFSHKMAFGPKGGPHEGKLFITSGDRQKLDPAQDMNSSLGKLIRLNDDGTLPTDNPWADGSKGDLARSFWSTGHRNPLGIAFDADGRLWSNEMGPRHGDELNLIQKGKNYGWPLVSEGRHYSGIDIPDHNTRPEFEPPKAHWIPSIAPSSLVIYSGDVFPQWKGDAFIGGLVSRALIRVDLNKDKADEAERFEWGKRIREVEQGPDGAIWVLEDKKGKLLKLTPGS